MADFTPKSQFLHIMQERGFIADCTNYEAVDEALSNGMVTAYIGYDATASSLHVGHLMNIIALRWFQRCGHRPITLMGGGTTKIGDPSFRSTERPMLTEAEIASNIQGVQSVFSRFLRYGTDRNDAIMVNNDEWLGNLNYLEFLRDVGRHFSVNRMLSFDSVKSRLDRDGSLSFLEFNYMLLQAYDFLELKQRYGCTMQMGGSDQWGNIVNGIELTRRSMGAEVFGLTTPLLTTADGNKMGKSAGKAVWLNPDMMSAYDFWQFWRNVDDADVPKFLRLFTELNPHECDRLAALKGSNINEAKIILANEVTSMIHGPEKAEEAYKAAQAVFAKNSTSADMPTVTLGEDEVEGGMSILNVLLKAGFSTSMKEGKRLIAGGGVKLNGEQITDIGMQITRDMLNPPIKLSAGRKRHALVRLDSDYVDIHSLSLLYEKVVGEPSQDDDMEAYDAILRRYVWGIEPDAFEAWCERHSWLGGRIAQHTQARPIFRLSAILVLYYTVAHKPTLVRDHCPIMESDLELIYSDLGLSLNG